MPVSEYSFPPRPKELVDIDEILASAESGTVIRADRNDPDARQSINVTWGGPYNLHTAMNAPGRLEVLVNGKQVYDVDSWVYHPSSGFTTVGEHDGLNIAPGQTATITVIPERITGDWKVELLEQN